MPLLATPNVAGSHFAPLGSKQVSGPQQQDPPNPLSVKISPNRLEPTSGKEESRARTLDRHNREAAAPF